MKNEIVNLFLYLVRLGIGHSDAAERDVFPQLSAEGWEALKDLATEQGLTAVVMDGYDVLSPCKKSMPDSIKKGWVDSIPFDYEYRYELYRRAIAELAAFYNANGYKMMILKGFACSLNWPRPEHRPCGDIDIWQFGQQKNADLALTKERGVEIDVSHHHHTVFYWRDFMVENHYDFINIHHHKSNVSIEHLFKQLGEDDSHYEVLYGETVYLPSPNLHALFLLKHAISHFASVSISLRHVLDWGFFVKEHSGEVDWKWLMGILDEYHMTDFFKCLNAICVEDLGFNTDCFPCVKFDEEIKSRVLNDVICPEFSESTPNKLVPRIIFKYRRWRANEWKHKLCYNESMWSSFWSGFMNHLLKPSSI